jgi:hypothetical protein
MKERASLMKAFQVLVFGVRDSLLFSAGETQRLRSGGFVWDLNDLRRLFVPDPIPHLRLSELVLKSI